MTVTASTHPRTKASGAVRRVDANAVLAVVAVAQFMVILDASVVNVALPTIKRDLGFSDQSLSWVLNAYTLLFGGFLLLGGRLADRLGRRRLFLAGIGLFSGASLVCGLSQSQTMLLVSRGVQGLGGAMVSPAALAIVLATFSEGRDRNRALAVWGAISGAGGAVGLLLGGLLVQALSWRWVFFINVPIGLAVSALAPRIVPESRAELPARGGYDAGGAVAVTLGTIALVFTLIKAGGWGWGSTRTLAGLVVSAVLIIAFVAIERHHRDPLVPLRIFANRSLTAANATMLVMAAALFGMFFFCTLYLQQVLNKGPLATGIAFLPLSLMVIAASGTASRLVDRFSPKPVLVAGMLISAAGFVLLTRVSGHADYASHVLPAMVVLGTGLGTAFVPVTIAATSGVAARDSGLASGLINSTQQVGGSLGLAILTSVATSRATTALHAGSPLPVALTRGFAGAFTAGGILCGVGVVLALVLLPRVRGDAGVAHVDATNDDATDAEAVALISSRCPGAPQCGYVARMLAGGRRPSHGAAPL